MSLPLAKIMAWEGDMVLYIEYVILDNLLIDFCLFRLMEKIFKEKFGWFRYSMGLLLGVLGAIFLPYVLRFRVLSIFYRIVLGLTMVLVIKKPRTFKMYMKYVFTFVGLTALLGGVIIGTLNVLNIRYTISGVICYDLELPMGIFLGILLFGLWCIKKVILCVQSSLKESNYMINIEIEDGEASISARGYLDSGNMVSVDGNMVSILSLDTFLKLHKEIGLHNVISGNLDENLKEVKYVQIDGISKGRKYPTFVVDKMVIADTEYFNQRVAIALKNFGNFDCILNSSFSGVNK